MKKSEAMSNKTFYECEKCKIPRSCYDLKHEPSSVNPDFSMPDGCRYGHFWILKYNEEV